MVRLLGPGSTIRRYTRYTNAPMMALGALGNSGGYRQPFCKSVGVFADNASHSVTGIGKFTIKKSR